MARGFATPVLPGGSGGLAGVMLLVIGLVGTTIAPWQLFFQQSYVIDKRITPRFMKYEKADLWLGIAIVVLGAAALMGVAAAAVAHTGAAGHFTDAEGLTSAISRYAGRAGGVLFAVALLDASIIGAFSVSLSSAYAIGDMLGMKHSLHRGAGQAKGFYALYSALIVTSAAIVLLPGSPLGLITEGVQVLAGVLLPSATVFLLLLCNDRAVLGPWVNGRRTNVFATAIITALITLSVVLTAAVVFPSITAGQIIAIIGACVTIAAAAGLTAAAARWLGHRRRVTGHDDTAATPRALAETIEQDACEVADKMTWRMPPLEELPAPVITGARRIALIALRGYLAIALVMVVVKVVETALAAH
jgi:hypothetical protein